MRDNLQAIQSSLGDRYRIDGEIGRGGMATVYAAEDLKHLRKVAVKVLDPEVGPDLGDERFLREVELTASFRHPHILPLLDSGRAGGLLYYITPLVEGESLRARLKRERQLPVDEAVKIAREVADALDYAHARGVVHRDIKPENILLESGHAWVADFGIARALGLAGEDRLTRTGFTVGTPTYASPEQLSGEGEVDGRSDVYSLACVLYEMLTGDAPHVAPTLAALLVRKAEPTPPAVRKLRPTVSNELETALSRSLAPVPADRPRTAGEFSRVLEAAWIPAGPTGDGVAATPGTTRRSGTRWVVILVASAVLVVAGILAIRMGPGILDSGPAIEADRVAVLPFSNQTGDPSLDPVGRWLADWLSDGLALAPEVRAVPSSMVLEVLAAVGSGTGGGSGPSILRRVAEVTGSGIAVTGSYYLRGNELEIHSDLVDVRTGESLAAVDPVRGPADDLMPAVDSVRAAVTGALATRFNLLTGWELPRGVQPPTYEAFVAYGEGMLSWVQGDYQAASGHFLRAYALDTTYVRSLLLAAAAASGPRSDSILAVAQSKRGALVPYDRFRLEYIAAANRGDWAGALAATRAGVDLSPGGTIHYALISVLEAVNRPNEALDESMRLREQNTAGAIWFRLPQNQSEILHQLGEYRRELELVRDAYDVVVSGHLVLKVEEGRALAGLRRPEEFLTVVREVAAASPEPDLNPGQGLWTLTREARAHGLEEPAAEAMGRALRWHQEQSATYRESAEGRLLLGRLLYEQESWAEAAETFEGLVGDPGRGIEARGHLGTLAARWGDEARARSIAQELSEIDSQRGLATLWRARISARLGEQEEAVELLRRAFGQGLSHGIWPHLDRDLEPLQDYGPFQELMKPQG